MCGIAGFNFNVDTKKVQKSLFHRGPDAQSAWSDENFHLIHTRLAIVDIAHGVQPFEYGEYVIVFNGEIYNHLELRKTLREFVFHTKSDTETLLYLYIKYKEKLFSKLDGMFAFAIYNKKTKQLFLARDRAGKKPLYIYQEGQKFAFASEINTLKFLPLSINGDDINLFLSTGFCESGYNEISEFPAGHYGYFQKELHTQRYFDILEYYQKPKITSFEESLTLVDEALEQSVKSRLLSSDVEVGAFLSGGIDSSLIVAKASKYKELQTFTVRFRDGIDESALASLVAKKYNTKHHIIDIEFDVKENIEHILQSYGRPFFDSSAVASYFVSKEARKYVKVVLNGDGADELFGGYRRYVPLANHFDTIAKYFSFLLPYLKPKNRSKLMFLQRLIRLSNKRGIEWYNTLLNNLFVDNYSFSSTKITQLNNFIESVPLNSFEKLLYIDFEKNLGGLLMKIDIATMQNSLEGRSPFLSKYFLELAPRIPYKIKGLRTKYILRHLAKSYLPQELINAPKRGFEVPLTKWVEQDLKEMIFDYLAKGFYKNFIDERFVQDIMENKTTISQEQRAKILYLLFSLEVWHENSLS